MAKIASNFSGLLWIHLLIAGGVFAYEAVFPPQSSCVGEIGWLFLYLSTFGTSWIVTVIASAISRRWKLLGASIVLPLVVYFGLGFVWTVLHAI